MSFHELAHRALVRFPPVSAADSRHALAIQRALDAFQQLRFGGASDELFSAITRHIIEITGAQRACVIVIGESGELAVKAGCWASFPDKPILLSELSQTVVRKVRERPQALRWSPVPVTDDTDPVQGLSEAELRGAASIRLSRQSILCVPMLRRGTLYGMLYADNHDTALAFTKFDREVLTLFAEQVAATVEAQQLLDRTQESLAQVRTLQERLLSGERLRIMGEISSGVAHEFNNLLTAILARLQILSLQTLPEEARSEMALIEKAANDAAEVVRRLQSFSRRQRQVDFARVELSGICQDALEMLAPLWREGLGGRASVEVRMRCAPHVVVRGAPTELRELATNLLKNAIEAVVAGGVVTVETQLRGGEAVLLVRDNGPGVPLELRERVFEEFFTTKGDAGTGLGLCLSRQIAERHGGTIEIQEGRPRGTTICVRLPAATATATQGESTAAVLPATGSSERLRVLVVDDEPDVLSSIMRYLQRLGHEIRGASSAEEALQILASWKPHVVLSDVGMPGMDGLELCAMIGEGPNPIPVVLMSGLADDLADRAKNAGVYELVAKPPRMAELNELLQRAGFPS